MRELQTREWHRGAPVAGEASRPCRAWRAGAAGRLLFLLAVALSASPAGADAEQGAAGPRGLVIVDSARSFGETVAALEDAIASKGLRMFTRIEHHANANAAGLELPPTSVLVFGNPDVGTGLMQARRTVAIDLPQKMLVWEEGGRVKLAYNDPMWLARRHQLPGEDATLEKVSELLRALAVEAAE